jgi:hypothetical protein
MRIKCKSNHYFMKEFRFRFINQTLRHPLKESTGMARFYYFKILFSLNYHRS